MPPPLSSIVPSPWLPSRETQQLAAHPWPPFPWQGLGELARPHKAFVVSSALSEEIYNTKTWCCRSLCACGLWHWHRKCLLFPAMAISAAVEGVPGAIMAFAALIFLFMYVEGYCLFGVN